MSSFEVGREEVKASAGLGEPAVCSGTSRPGGGQVGLGARGQAGGLCLLMFLWGLSGHIQGERTWYFLG